jgi:predicted transposase
MPKKNNITNSFSKQDQQALISLVRNFAEQCQEIAKKKKQGKSDKGKTSTRKKELKNLPSLSYISSK